METHEIFRNVCIAQQILNIYHNLISDLQKWCQWLSGVIYIYTGDARGQIFRTSSCKFLCKENSITTLMYENILIMRRWYTLFKRWQMSIIKDINLLLISFLKRHLPIPVPHRMFKSLNLVSSNMWIGSFPETNSHQCLQHFPYKKHVACLSLIFTVRACDVAPVVREDWTPVWTSDTWKSTNKFDGHLLLCSVMWPGIILPFISVCTAL
jgi:hypothetical protein